MSATPAAMNTSASMTVRVEGLLDSVRQHGGRYMGVVILPAEDKFSSPQYVEVQSDSPIGQPGSEVKMTCKLGGYRNNFTTKQGELVRSADVRLIRV